MYFSSHQERSGTIIQISRPPSPKEKEIIVTFIQERGGDFTGVSDYREFFIRKLLQPEDVERYFKVYNLPFIQEGTLAPRIENPIKDTLPPSLSKKTYIMSFGNYKDKPLHAIPEGYIKWLSTISADPELLHACHTELKQRNTISIR